MPDRTDDQALLDALAAGDRPAAELWVERTYGLVFASLVRLTGGDRDLATDLTQETYRKAWQSLSGFRGGASSSTWLYRIAYTTFLNHVRRPHRLVPLDAEHGDALPDPAPSVDELLAGGEARGRLRRAVMALADPLRFTLTAHYWAGLAPKEIARLEGISSVAVRKRLRKALAVLDTLLKEIER
jgi:RNA polymerase sigma-70 factor (ECF subfamily)